MPQLPSGRHVAVNAEPIQALIDKAYETVPPAAFLAIKSRLDLLPYIKVIYLREASGGDIVQEHMASQPVPPGMEAYDSGYNLLNIKDEVQSWSREDQEAFMDFLNSERFETFLDGVFQTVQKVRTELQEHGTFLQQVASYWWQAGVHPAQDD